MEALRVLGTFLAILIILAAILLLLPWRSSWFMPLLVVVFIIVVLSYYFATLPRMKRMTSNVKEVTPLEGPRERDGSR